MNILLSCVGRRNYLVDYFRHALAGQGQVFAANTYAESAGMAVADKRFLVPPVTDKSYVDVLLKICKDNNVKLLIPLIDLDVVVLSRAKDRLCFCDAMSDDLAEDDARIGRWSSRCGPAGDRGSGWSPTWAS